MRKVTLAVGTAHALLACAAPAWADADQNANTPASPATAPTSLKDANPHGRGGKGVLAAQPVSPRIAAQSGLLWSNLPVDGVNGYSNGTAGVFSGFRRTLLDDFDLPQLSRANGLQWNSVWGTPGGGAMGTGLEISFRSDVAGTPGGVVAVANVSGYSEMFTGNLLFSREEVTSFATFDDVALGAGRYWIEATVVGPENNFWLTSDQLLNECWVNYEDLGGLQSGTQQFGVASDINFYLLGEPAGACCLEGDCIEAAFEGECAPIGGTYFPGLRCDEVQCLAPGCVLDEHFDIYADGSTIVPQGGWEPWDGDPTVQFGTVTSAQSRSAPHSLEIDDTDDIVHRFSGINSGQWVLELYQYIPAGLTGQQYVILLNTYTNAADANWSSQLLADGATGLVTDFNGTGSTPIVFDQWIPIRVEIDLDADRQVVSYDGNVVIDDTWSGHVPPAGVLEVAAIDLFSNGATRVFYDDITLCRVASGGACCVDMQCIEGSSPGDCALQGGEYLGDGSTCAGVQCGIGACCFGAQCVENVSRVECTQSGQGGLFLGTGSGCGGVDCRTLGACCLPPIDTPRGPVLPQPSCCLTTQAVCELVKQGLFLGEGVPCEQIVLVPIHEGPREDWSHQIRVESNCPKAVDGDGTACVDGPYHVDPWITNGSLTENCHDFSIVCPLPAGFLAPGSDPVVDIVCFKGEPIGDIDLPGFGVLNFGEADTLVRREFDPFDACDEPSANAVDVPIELIALNLVTVEPLIVTFNGGQNPEEWDVRITVDPDEQPGGTLTATKDHCNGGTFDSNIDACPTFTFRRRSDGRTVELDYCASCDPGGVPMEWNDVPWVTFIRGNNEIVNAVCTAFTPGVQETNPTQDCDCNLNGVFDGAFNPCDPQNVCDRCGDTDGDGIVRFNDILRVLSGWGGGPNGDADCNGSVDFQDILKILGNWD